MDPLLVGLLLLAVAAVALHRQERDAAHHPRERRTTPW